MEKQVITVDQNLRELCEHGSPAFPMTVSHDDLSLFLDQYIRCHWHGDLEIVVVQKGKSPTRFTKTNCSCRLGTSC